MLLTFIGAILCKTAECVRDTAAKAQAMASLESRRTVLTAAEYQEELEDLAEADHAGQLSHDVGVMKQVGSFDQIVIWGHEIAPQGSEEKVVRMIGEGIKIADAIGRW